MLGLPIRLSATPTRKCIRRKPEGTIYFHIFKYIYRLILFRIPLPTPKMNIQKHTCCALKQYDFQNQD